MTDERRGADERVDRERVGGPASGVPARGYAWPPFEEGNERAVTHGFYSPRRLLVLAEERYAELRETFTPWDPAYELPVRQLAENQAARQLLLVYVDEHGLIDDEGNVRPILKELPRLERRATDLYRELALTVRSRLELDIDRLALERGYVELAELERVQALYHEFIAELAAAAESGEPVSRDEILRRLEARIVAGFGGGDVVDGSARALGPGDAGEDEEPEAGDDA